MKTSKSNNQNASAGKTTHNYKALKILLSFLLVALLIPVNAIPQTAWAEELGNTVGDAVSGAVSTAADNISTTAENISNAAKFTAATTDKTSAYYPNQASYDSRTPGSAKLTQTAAWPTTDANTLYNTANLTLDYTSFASTSEFEATGYDYLFMIDASQNVGATNLATAKDLANNIVSTAATNYPDSRYGFIAFDEGEISSKNFNKSAEGFASSLDNVTCQGGSKSYINAIAAARTILANRSSSGANKVVLVWLTNGTSPESSAAIADAMNVKDEGSAKTLRELVVSNAAIQVMNGSTATEALASGICNSTSLCEIYNNTAAKQSVSDAVVSSAARAQLTDAKITVTIDTNNFEVDKSASISAPGFNVVVGSVDEATNTQLVTLTQKSAMFSGVSYSVNIPLRSTAKHAGMNDVTAENTATTMTYNLNTSPVQGATLQPANVGLQETGYTVTYDIGSGDTKAKGRDDIPSAPQTHFAGDEFRLALGYGLVPASEDGQYFSKWHITYTDPTSSEEVNKICNEGETITMPATNITITPLFNKQSINKSTETEGDVTLLVYPGFSKNNVSFADDQSIFTDICTSGITTITEAEFVKGETSGITGTDVSTNQDGSILAYVDDTKLIVISAGNIVCSPTSCKCLFDGFTGVSKITFTNFNTTGINTLYRTFRLCHSLVALNVENFDTSAVTSLVSCFDECQAITSLDLHTWDVKKVTSCHTAFKRTYALQVLDLSGWNLESNSYMSYTFESSFTSTNPENNKIIGLSDIYPSTHKSKSLDTQYMFVSSNLKINIDLSSWHLPSSIYIVGMFRASAFTGIDVHGWDVSSITTSYRLFLECTQLNSIDVSGWYVKSATTTERMFQGIGSAVGGTKIYGVEDLCKYGTGKGSISCMFTGAYIKDGELDLSNWDISNVTWLPYIFMNTKVSKLNLEGWTFKFANEGINHMFEGCGNTDGLEILGMDDFFSDDITYTITSFEAMFSCCTLSGNIDLTSWSKAIRSSTNFKYMFQSCTKITKLNISGWHTVTANEFTDFFYDFGAEGCEIEGLQDLLSEGTTSSTISFHYMFAASRLSEIYLQTWDASKLVWSQGMFRNCTSLKTIYVSKDTDWSPLSITNSQLMFSGCSALVGGEGTTVGSTVDKTYAKVDKISTSGNAGYFTCYIEGNELAYPDLTQPNTGHVFNAEESIFANYGTSIPLSQINTVEFSQVESLPTGTDVSKKGDGSIIANYDSSSKKLTLSSEQMIVSSAESCSYLFKDFTSLTNVIFSSFNTSRISSLAHMFDGCKTLGTMDLSAFKTTLVTDMSYAFNNCKNLTSVNLTDWNTKNCTTFENMFAISTTEDEEPQNAVDLTITGLESLCSTLTKDANMSGMFSHSNLCPTAATIDLTTWANKYIINAASMFEGIHYAGTINLSNWALTNLTNASGMFKNASALTGITFGGLASTSITDASSMFEGCKAITELNLTGLSLQSATNTSAMFKDFGSTSTVVTDLGNIAKSGFGTSATGGADASSMFEGSAFTTLDLTKWNVKNIANYERMFAAMTSLQTLNITGWGINSATNISAMFNGDTALTKIDGINSFCKEVKTTEDEITSGAIFAGCRALPTLALSLWNTAKFNSFAQMFEGCETLDNLEIDGWVVSNSNNLTSMFKDCKKLESIDGLDCVFTDQKTGTDASALLQGCVSVKTLDVQNWDLTNAKSVDNLFNGCTNLVTVLANETSDWSKISGLTGNDMFKDCSSIRGKEDTKYSSSNVGLSYAKIDHAKSASPSSPGYFTYDTDAVLKEPTGTDEKTSILDAYKEATSVEFVKAARPATFEGSICVDNKDNYDIIAYKVENTTGNGYHVVVNCDGNITCDKKSCRAMFNGFTNLTSVSFDNFNMTGITDLSYMFNGATAIKGIDLSNWKSNIKLVTDATDMFKGCTSLVELNLDGWTFGTCIKDITGMFADISHSTTNTELTVTGIEDLLKNGVAKEANLSGVFENSKSIKNLSIANWNANNAQTLNAMFKDCENLTNLNVGTMYVKSATDLGEMFSGVKSITTITNINNLCKNGVGASANLSQMFYNCSALTNLNISNWHLINADNLSQMCKGCINLESIDLSKWNGKLANATNLSEMFSGCIALTSANLNNVGLGAATNLSNMFYGCTELASVYMVGDATKSAQDMTSMFEGCKKLATISGIGSLLTGHELADDKTLNISSMFKECEAIQQLNLSGWTTNYIASAQSAFDGCKVLEYIDITGWVISKATDLSKMFNGCAKLAEINGSETLLENGCVKNADLSDMFNTCKALTTLNLEKWDTSNAEKTDNMFKDCTSLVSIYVEKDGTHSDWSKSTKITSSSNMFFGCTSIRGKEGTTYDAGNANDITFAKIDRVISSSSPAYFTYAPTKYWLMEPTLNNDTDGDNQSNDETVGILNAFKEATSVEFTIDQLPSSYKEVINVGAEGSKEDIKAFKLDDGNGGYKVRVNSDGTINCNPLSCVAMFKGFTNLNSVTFDNFYADGITDMSYMFNNATTIETINLSSLSSKVSTVVKTQHMFDGCNSLTSLDLTNWSLSSSLSDASYMFANINSTEITVNGLNKLLKEGVATGATLSNMFANSTAFTSINLQGWNIDNALDLSCMFQNCEALTSLNLRYLYAKSAIDMSALFKNCKALTSIQYINNLCSAGVGTSSEKETTLEEMFDGCSSLSSLSISDWNMTNANNLHALCRNCTSLASISINAWKGKVGNITNMSEAFKGCVGLKTANINTLAFDSAINLASMFEGCSALTTLNTTDTIAKVAQDLSFMFSGCSSLKSITGIGSLLSTHELADDKVATLQGMFKGDTTLVSLALNTWKSNSFGNLSSAFEGCAAMTTLNITGWVPSKCSDFSSMFSGCALLNNISGLDTLASNGVAENTNLDNMFKGCSAITSLSLELWNVKNAVSSNSMFEGCTTLEKIYVDNESEYSDWSHISTSASKNMFLNCSVLVGKQGTKYSATHLDASYAKIDKAITESIPAYFTYHGKPVYLAEPNPSTPTTGILNTFNKAESVEFVLDSIPDGYTGKIYVDKDNKGDIIAFKVPTGEGDNYKVVVNCDGQIKCSPLSTKALFKDFENLKSVTFTNFDFSEVTDTSFMFNNCSSMQTVDLSGWKTIAPNITSIEDMFKGCSALENINLNGWLFSSVLNNASAAFSYITPEKILSIQGIDKLFKNGVAEDATFKAIFEGSNIASNLSFSSWNLTNVVDFSYAFANCDNISAINFNGLALPNATDLSHLLEGCTVLTSVKNLKVILQTCNVDDIDLSYLFSKCTSITSIDLTGCVTDTSKYHKSSKLCGMYKDCIKLANIVGFDTMFESGLVQGADLTSLFENCAAFTLLNVSKWDMSNVEKMDRMFADCSSLSTIICTETTDWSTSAALKSSTNMFEGCTNILGVEGTEYSEDHLDKQYARVDLAETAQTPGYFSYPTAYLANANTRYSKGIINSFNGATSVSFTKKTSMPTTYAAKIDVSNKDICAANSVVAYKIMDSDSSYHVEICSTMKINASETSLHCLFKGFSNLTQVSFDNLAITTATTMHGMFQDCKKLTKLNGFVGLAKKKLAITDMSDMFTNCSSMTSIDLSSWAGKLVCLNNLHAMFYQTGMSSINLAGWDTSNVTSMDYMFTNNTKLTYLNITGWRASSCTNMSYAFNGCSNAKLTTIVGINDLCSEGVGTNCNMDGLFMSCSGLTSLDLNWNVENVGSMYGAFAQNAALQTIDMSTWHANNCDNFSFLFYGSSAITEIKGIINLCDGLEATNVQMQYLFYQCSKLTSAEMTNWKMGEVVNTEAMFASCSAIENIDLHGCDLSKTTTMRYMFYGCTNAKTIDLSNCNAKSCSNFYGTFYECVNLSSVGDVSYLCDGLTANEVNMSFMFYDCKSLPTISTNAWDTENVVSMEGTFVQCESLTRLNVRNWKIDKLASTQYMFLNCYALKTINAGSTTDWSTSTTLTNSTYMFFNCVVLEGSQGTKYYTEKVADKTYARTDYAEAGKKGYFTDTGAYAILDEPSKEDEGILNKYNEATTVTFATSLSTPSSEWIDVSVDKDESIKAYKVANSDGTYHVEVISKSSIKTSQKSLVGLFSNFSKLQSFDISALKMADITSLSYMFNNCAIPTIDLSCLSTSLGSVEYMSYMFNNCSASSIDFSSWKNVSMTLRYAPYMFNGCKNLATLDLANVNLWRLRQASHLFSNCTSLITISLTNNQFANMVDASSMFEGCSALTTIDGLETLYYSSSTSVLNANSMFKGCSSMTFLNLMYWFTEQFSDFSSMFEGCTSLITILTTANFYAKNATSFKNLCKDCTSLTNFPNLHRLVSTDSPSNIDFTSAFENCKSMADFSLYFGDVSKKITITKAMFKGCTGVSSLDIRYFYVDNVTDCSEMFDGCSTLKLIYCSENTDWKSSAKKLKNSKDMFLGCDILEGLEGTSVADKKTYDITYAKVDRNETFSKPGYFSEYIDPVYLANPTTQASIFYKYKDAVQFDFVRDQQPTSYTDCIDVSKDKNNSIIAYQVPENDEDGSYRVVVNSSYLINCSEYSLMYMFYQFSKLRSVNFYNFYTTKTQNASCAFQETAVLNKLYMKNWDLSNMTEAVQLFYASGVKQIYMNGTVAPKIKSLDYAFYDCPTLEVISGLEDLLSAGTASDCTLKGMFSKTGLWGLKLNLEKWDVSKVIDMYALAYQFGGEQINFGAWNANSVTTMAAMVTQCPFLTQVSFAEGSSAKNCTDFQNMFAENEKLQNVNGIKYLFSQGTGANSTIRQMFGNCTWLESVDFSDSNLTNVSDIYHMFVNCTGIKSINFHNTTIPNVTSMEALFYGCKSLETVDLSYWDGNNCLSFNQMFAGCESLTHIEGIELLCANGTAEYADMGGMFLGLKSLKSLDLHLWDITQVYSLQNMFTGSTGLESIKWGWEGRGEAVKCRKFSGMFWSCANLKEIENINNLLSKGTEHTCSLDSVFSNCHALEGTLTLDKWDTSKVTSFTNLFACCMSLKYIDISNWSIKYLQHLDGMFTTCSNLERIFTNSKCWWTPTLADARGMTSRGIWTSCYKLEAADFTRWGHNLTYEYFEDWSGRQGFNDLECLWTNDFERSWLDKRAGIFTPKNSNETCEEAAARLAGESSSANSLDSFENATGGVLADTDVSSLDESITNVDSDSAQKAESSENETGASSKSETTAEETTVKESSKTEEAESAQSTSVSSEEATDADSGNVLSGIVGAIASTNIADAFTPIQTLTNNVSNLLNINGERQLYDKGLMQENQTIIYTLDIANSGDWGAEVSDMAITDELPVNTTYVDGSLSAANVAWIDTTGKPTYIDTPSGYIDASTVKVSGQKLTFNACNLSAHAHIYLTYRVKVNSGISTENYQALANTATFENGAKTCNDTKMSTNGVSDTVRHYAGKASTGAKHKITFAKDGDGISEVYYLPVDNIEYGEGDTVYLPTMPNGDTCTFDHWRVGTEDLEKGTNTFIMPGNDVVVTAVYTSKTYTKTYNIKHTFKGMNGESESAADLPAYVPYVEDYASCDDWMIPIPSADQQEVANYTFNYSGTTIKLLKGGSEVGSYAPTSTELAAGEFARPRKDLDYETIEIVQTYERNKFEVKYEYSNTAPSGAGDLPETQNVKWGESVTVAQSPTQPSGYQFFGWYINPNPDPCTPVTNGQSFTMPATDVTLSGSWDGDKYVNILVQNATGESAGSANPSYAKGEQYIDIATTVVGAETAVLYDADGGAWSPQPDFNQTTDGRWQFQMPDLTSYDKDTLIVKILRASDPPTFDDPSAEYTYDGSDHTIKDLTITTPVGCSVKYANDSGEYELDEPPVFKNAGEYTVGFQITTPGETSKSYNYTASVKINKKSVGPVVKVENKEYDKTVYADISASFKDGDLASGENIEIKDLTAQFADYNAGTKKPVSCDFTQARFEGDSTDNYEITWPTSLNADITPRQLSIEGITAVSRPYDGTDVAEISGGGNVSGKIEGDDVTATVGSTGKFASKDVGTGINVSAVVTLSGADMANYSEVVKCETATADITALEIYVDGITADSKVYDGNMDATLDFSAIKFYYESTASVWTEWTNETLALNEASAKGEFEDAAPGTAKTVNISDLVLADGTGEKAGTATNYSLITDTTKSPTSQTTTKADITNKELTVTGIVAKDKVYDGDNEVEEWDLDNVVITGAVEDDLKLISVKGTFDDENVGEGKTVTLSDFVFESGSTEYKYDVSTASKTTTASITPKHLTSKATKAEDKYYDGKTDATLDDATIDGILDSDKSSVTTKVTASFIDKNAASDIEVIVNVDLSGTRAGNYVFVPEEQNQITGTIAQLPVIIDRTGTTKITKLYDGTTVATIGDLAVYDYSKPESKPTKGDKITEDLKISYSAAYDAPESGERTVNFTTSDFVIADGEGANAGLAANYSLEQSASIATTPGYISTGTVKVSGISALDKEYDGTNVANLGDFSQVLIEGAVESDLVLKSVKATFNDEKVGINKTVTLDKSSFVFYSQSKGQEVTYAISEDTQLEFSANITVKLVTLKVTINDKVYDGNTTATVKEKSIEGVIGSELEKVSFNVIDPTFDSPHAQDNKNVSAEYELTGDEEVIKNYEIDRSQLPTLKASITRKPVEVKDIESPSKIYDKTVNIAFVSESATLDGCVEGESLGVKVEGIFSDYNVGVDKDITLLSLSLVDTDTGLASDYSLSTSLSSIALKGNIVARPVVIYGFSAKDKVYDGTNKVDFDYTYASFVNIVPGDNLGVQIDAHFKDPDAQKSKDVVLDGFDLTGSSKDNYIGALLPEQQVNNTLTTTPMMTGANSLTSTNAVVSDVDNSLFAADTDTLLSSDANSLNNDEGGNKLTDANDDITVANADIEARPIDVTGITAESRDYDATTNTVFNTDNVVIVNKVEADQISVANVEGAFQDPDAGSDKTVVINSFDLVGSDETLKNYTLRNSQQTTTADIYALDITDYCDVVLGDLIVYDGEEHEQTIISVKRGDFDVTYYVEGNTGTDPAQYNMRIQGYGNFTGDVYVLWVIVNTEEELEWLKGSVEVDVEAGDDAPEPTLVTDKMSMIKSVCDANDMSAVANGKNLKIWVDVKNIDKKISVESKQLLDDFAATSSLTNAQYLDIKLLMQLDSEEEPREITTAKNDIEVLLGLQKEIYTPKEKTELSNFNLVKNHQGTVTNTGSAYDDAEHSFDLVSKEFSDYAVAYNIKHIEDENTEQVAPAQTGTATSDNNGVVVLGVLVMALASFGIAIYARRYRNSVKKCKK